MNWLSNLFAGGVGTLVDKVGGVIDNLHTSDEEKAQLKIQMKQILQKRDSEVEQTIRAQLGARERMLVAELNQGDSYTKRARPTVVYSGLVFIFVNYVAAPLISQFAGVGMEPLELPTEFWAGWSGIVMSWSLGRSFEKRGSTNPFVRGMTGSAKPSKLLDD